MTPTHAQFGTDLRLLGDLVRQNDRAGGSDFKRVESKSGDHDIDILEQVENLQQALLLRFLTRQGDLTVLGHPDYGSRLYTLIGELNNPTNRNRAKLFVLEALAAEPRIARVISVDVTAGARDRIDIAVSLLTIANDTPLNFVFPFFVGGPQ
jgi:phage baseplate assembly protein W